MKKETFDKYNAKCPTFGVRCSSVEVHKEFKDFVRKSKVKAENIFRLGMEQLNKKDHES